MPVPAGEEIVGLPGTINAQRTQIDGLLLTIPSLRRLVADYVFSTYASARQHAASDRYAPVVVSRGPPYSLAQLLDSSYFP